MMYAFFQCTLAWVTLLAFPFWAHSIIHSNYHAAWLLLTLAPWVFTAWAIFLDYLLGVCRT